MPDYTSDFLLNVLTEAYSTAHPIDCCAFAGDLWFLFFGEKNALQNMYPTAMV